MKSIILKSLTLLFAIFATTPALWAGNPTIALSCDPDGASVYLNGQLICAQTPAIVEVPSKIAKRTMMFQFVKNGYESRTITVAYTKKQLKAEPIVYCTLKKKEVPIPVPTAEPTVTKAQERQRVDRNNAGKTDMEKTILRWFFDSDPRGARIYYRVISSVPNEVKNTNETYLTTTPLEETRGFNIQGLTYNNSRDVTIEVKVSKRGYEDQIKRFNVRQAIDQQEISGFFEMVPKEIAPTDIEE